MDATQALILDLEGKLKRCGNCKWFSRNKDAYYGECDNESMFHQYYYQVMEYEDITSKQKSNNAVVSSYEDVYVTVGEDFGCIHFEVK